jgi:stalled ribosome rescue protein Dom34
VLHIFLDSPVNNIYGTVQTLLISDRGLRNKKTNYKKNIEELKKLLDVLDVL